MKDIYLDNAATTQLDERVLAEMMLHFKEYYGNPSSVHKAGRDAKVLLEEARDIIAAFIGARPSELYFTSGGTEANNFAIKGMAFHQLEFTPDGEEKRKYHIVSTEIEHSAVIDTLEYLKNRFGFEITYLNTNKFGEIDLDMLNDSVTEDTFLICAMHSNNELGVINNIAQISQIAKQKDVLLHTDSVQSIGKVHFNVNELFCDTATLSAHKIYGPKGIGALYIRKYTPLDKFIHGGKQERDRRGGTENIAAIAGFKKAVELLKKEMNSDIDKYKLLKRKLIYLLKENFGEKVIINSLEKENSLHNIVNISFDRSKVKIDPDTLLIKLDLKGIAISSGSACTSGSIQPSHVLKSIGYDDATAKSSLRISFGRLNSESDLDYLIDAMKSIIQ
ncbi:MAG: cysteine desulfurase [Chlorobi bacterium]|nr:cysteine desulfurase [Chlorobiota bacterium]MCI0715633.1 cysteine desulfurase [Chlorobiota bacterium]